MISKNLTDAFGRKLRWLVGSAASHFPGSAEGKCLPGVTFQVDWRVLFQRRRISVHYTDRCPPALGLPPGLTVADTTSLPGFSQGVLCVRKVNTQFRKSFLPLYLPLGHVKRHYLT